MSPDCIQPAEEVAHPPHADRWMSSDPYVTEIWCPEPDNGIQRLHSPMREPEPEAEPESWEPEWDSADSNAYQARVEAGVEPEAEAEL